MCKKGCNCLGCCRSHDIRNGMFTYRSDYEENLMQPVQSYTEGTSELPGEAMLRDRHAILIQHRDMLRKAAHVQENERVREDAERHAGELTRMAGECASMMAEQYPDSPPLIDDDADEAERDADASEKALALSVWAVENNEPELAESSLIAALELEREAELLSPEIGGDYATIGYTQRSYATNHVDDAERAYWANLASTVTAGSSNGKTLDNYV